MYPSSLDSNPSITDPGTLSAEESSNISPSKSWYFVAGVLFVVFIVASIVAVVGVVSFVDDIEDFRDPQTLTITTDRAVSRDIWTSSASRRVTVVAVRLDEGPLPIVSERNSSNTITINNKNWSDIGSIDFPGPGEYVVSATPSGAEIALVPIDQVTPIGIWGGTAGAAAVGAFVVWLLTMIRRRKAKKAQLPAQNEYAPNQVATTRYSEPSSPDTASAPYPAAPPPPVQYHKPGQGPQQSQSSPYHKPGQRPHRVDPALGPTQPRPPQLPPNPSGEPAVPPWPDPSTSDDNDPTTDQLDDQATEGHQRATPRATVQPKPAPDPFNQHRKPLPKSPIENAPSDDGPISKG